MTQNVRFSVITVCYNDCTALDKTIRSVLSQSYTNFEYIIIDGGSDDGSVELINKYNNLLSYWISEPDGGVYQGMNKAIIQAKGEFCIFMNAGDTFANTDVLLNASKVDLHDVDLAVGSALMTKQDCVMSVVPPPSEISFGFFLYFSIIHQAAFMRSSLLKDHPYDENYSIVSDWKYMISEYLHGIYRYKQLNFEVCMFDTTGISSNVVRRESEREQALKELLPPMLYSDMEKFKDLKFIFSQIDLRQKLMLVFRSQTLRKCLIFLCDVMLKLKKIRK